MCPNIVPVMETLATALADFISRCDAYAQRRGIKRSTLSAWLFNDGKRLDQIAGGQSDVGIGRLARAVTQLDGLEAESEAA